MATIRRKPWTLCRPRVHQRAEHPGKVCRHQAAGHGLHHACPLPSAERTRWPACPPGRHPAGHQARHGHHQGAGGGSMPAACIRQARRARRAARHPSAGAPGHQAQAMQRRAWPPSGASRGHHQRGAGGGLHHACRFHATALQRPCGRHAAQGVDSMPRTCRRVHQRAGIRAGRTARRSIIITIRRGFYVVAWYGDSAARRDTARQFRRGYFHAVFIHRGGGAASGG